VRIPGGLNHIALTALPKDGTPAQGRYFPLSICWRLFVGASELEHHVNVPVRRSPFPLGQEMGRRFQQSETDDIGGQWPTWGDLLIEQRIA